MTKMYSVNVASVMFSSISRSQSQMIYGSQMSLHTWLPCRPHLSYNTAEVECRKIHTVAPNLSTTKVLNSCAKQHLALRTLDLIQQYNSCTQSRTL